MLAGSDPSVMAEKWEDGVSVGAESLVVAEEESAGDWGLATVEGDVGHPTRVSAVCSPQLAGSAQSLLLLWQWTMNASVGVVASSSSVFPHRPHRYLRRSTASGLISQVRCGAASSGSTTIPRRKSLMMSLASHRASSSVRSPCDAFGDAGSARSRGRAPQPRTE
jgi:hypothetical protein